MQVLLSRKGNVWGIPLTLSKAITLSAGSDTVELGYRLEDLPDNPLTARLIAALQEDDYPVVDPLGNHFDAGNHRAEAKSILAAAHSIAVHRELNQREVGHERDLAQSRW